MSEAKFIIKHKGTTQVGRPFRTQREAFQRAYDRLSALDWKNLSKREKEQAFYTIEEI